jgi:hypothetical protein
MAKETTKPDAEKTSDSLEELRKELERERKRRADTQRAFHERSSELANIKAELELLKQKSESEEGSVDVDVDKLSELERRKLILEDFKKLNPDFELTDENVQYDLPPKLVKGLETGELTFDNFLQEAKKYLETPKEVEQPPTPPEEPKLDRGQVETPEIVEEAVPYEKSLF